MTNSANSAEDIRATLEAGRAAVAAGLRQVADRVDALPLDAATDALGWLRDELGRLQREAARIFANL